jgi:hypothetical protein
MLYIMLGLQRLQVREAALVDRFNELLQKVSQPGPSDLDSIENLGRGVCLNVIPQHLNLPSVALARLLLLLHSDKVTAIEVCEETLSKLPALYDSALSQSGEFRLHLKRPALARRISEDPKEPWSMKYGLLVDEASEIGGD